MTNFDESDQAGMIGGIFAAHLNREDHGGKPKEDCEFCKGFILDERPLAEQQKLQSYSFVFLDTSKDK